MRVASNNNPLSMMKRYPQRFDAGHPCNGVLYEEKGEYRRHSIRQNMSLPAALAHCYRTDVSSPVHPTEKANDESPNAPEGGAVMALIKESRPYLESVPSFVCAWHEEPSRKRGQGKSIEKTSEGGERIHEWSAKQRGDPVRVY